MLPKTDRFLSFANIFKKISDALLIRARYMVAEKLLFSNPMQNLKIFVFMRCCTSQRSYSTFLGRIYTAVIIGS